MKSQLISALSSAPTTNNGAPTLSTSDVPVLDFFFKIGSARYDAEESVNLFYKAYTDSPLEAVRTLFYSRDVRGGQGERNLFRTVLTGSANKSLPFVLKNISSIPRYGRWDDLMALVDTPLESHAINYWAQAIRNGDPLACKWAPREKSSKATVAHKLRTALGLSPRNYRKLLAKNTKVVETQMCSDDWDSISYDSVPSKAMNNYKNAFARHSPDKWSGYIERLTDGLSTVNSSTLYPHELINDLLQNSCRELSKQEQVVLNAQWNSLPDYMKGTSQRILPLVDVSGSMYGTYGFANNGPAPISVAVALGIYIAQRNTGSFANHFMTFSQTPSIESIDPNLMIHEQVSNMSQAAWGMNTDLDKVFRTLLSVAKRDSVSREDMPTMVLILSDMEFDTAMSNPYHTNYEAIRKSYSDYGYDMPKIVFWNINASRNNFPVSSRDENTLLVGGFSPSIMKHILKTGSVTPMDLLNEVINSSRYADISV